MSEPKSKMRRNLKPASSSKLLNLPASIVRNVLLPYFDSKVLSAISQTCTENRNLYKNDCKTSALLFYGLNITRARKKKLKRLLAEQDRNVPSVILTRVNGRQVYYSENLKGTVCTRIFSAISPLEAAVLCGDFPLVRLLLKNLPENQNKAAVLQLKAIRKNLESDPRSFASLINALQKAYKELEKNCITLFSNGDSTELENLKGFIGENQKTLPWFILQVFCRLVPHEPLPDFTKEPKRECRLVDDSELNLDLIGRLKGALYKGFGSCAVVDGHFQCEIGEEAFYVLDSEALDSLCKEIKSELDNIIQLQEKTNKLREQEALLAAYPNSGGASASP